MPKKLPAFQRAALGGQSNDELKTLIADIAALAPKARPHNWREVITHAEALIASREGRDPASCFTY